MATRSRWDTASTTSTIRFRSFWKKLGAGYDVNLIAHRAGHDMELYGSENYPLRPNVVILSYYLNDIDYLMTDTTRTRTAISRCRLKTY